MARTFSPKLESGHRSRIEQRIANHLDSLGVPYGYETLKLTYTVPETSKKYTPDFILSNGIIVEAKGWPFDSQDRQKLLLVRDQHPHLDIRLIFENPLNKINTGSQTTYADWATQHGFQYAAKLVPSEWITDEKPPAERLIRTTTKKSSSRTSPSTKRRTSKTAAS